MIWTDKMMIGMLAVLMLALSVMPCNDGMALQPHQISVDQPEQDHHDHENDFCSPFCSCSCCSTVIAFVHEVKIQTIVQPAHKNYPREEQSFVSVFIPDCWQPPRAA